MMRLAALLATFDLAVVFSNILPSTNFTCEAGNFTVGQNASVICNLGEENSTRLDQLYIVHHPFSASKNFSGKTVLVCFMDFFGSNKCTSTKGYSYENSGFTARVRLSIPQVSAEFAGNYSCQPGMPDGKPKNVCSLYVEAPGRKTPRTPEIKETTTLEYKEPPTIQNRESANRFALFAVVPVIVVVVSAALYCIWKHKKDGQTPSYKRITENGDSTAQN